MRHDFLLIFVYLVDKNCGEGIETKLIVLLQWDKALPLGKSQGNPPETITSYM